MTTYQWTDPNGNTYTLLVRADTTVALTNQHSIPLSLSNVAFLTNGNGTVEQNALVRNAAIQGLAALRAVTKLDWRVL